MISTLISLFLTYQISAAADYENCGVLPLSDFCETITWKRIILVLVLPVDII